MWEHTNSKYATHRYLNLVSFFQTIKEILGSLSIQRHNHLNDVDSFHLPFDSSTRSEKRISFDMRDEFCIEIKRNGSLNVFLKSKVVIGTAAVFFIECLNI